MALDVRALPVLSDNYVWLLRETEGNAVGVVDPAEAAPVADALDRLGWKLTHIFNTHHHGDHTGGNLELKARYGAKVVGAKADAARLPGLDQGVAEGDTVSFGQLNAQVFEVPGHTSGHIAFWFADAEALFCGDTLFALGCGRLFEGAPSQMWNSLLKLRALPDAARVYCAHEYTQSNARFAAHVDPGNKALAARKSHIDALRAKGEATVPSLLSEERETNPFLRADDPRLAAAVGLAGAPAWQVFAEIRSRKDSFR